MEKESVKAIRISNRLDYINEAVEFADEMDKINIYYNIPLEEKNNPPPGYTMVDDYFMSKNEVPIVTENNNKCNIM